MNRQDFELPTVWSPGLTTEPYAPLERALEELVKDDQWIGDFIKRLNHAIDDVVRQKH